MTTIERESPNPFLAGNLAPVHEEVTVTDLCVTGTIPTELTGRYLRNGPNPGVPTASQGRIYGLQMSLIYTAPPVGQLLVGWGIESIGLRGTFSIVLALFALTAATIASSRSLSTL